MKKIFLTLIFVLFVIPFSSAQINITLNGEPQYFIEFGRYYYEYGATAYESENNDISSSIEISNNVNLNALGTYTVTYTATSSSGETHSVTRSVIVQDTSSPVFIFKNDDSVEIYPNKTDYSFDFVAIDNYDGDITSQVSYEYGVPSTTPGESFTDQISVTDSNGNTTTRTLDIYVRPIPSPTLNLLGDDDNNDFKIGVGETFIDPGYYAFDKIDGVITDDVIVDYSALNTTTLGDYQVTYTITNSGGLSTTETRTVSVVDKNYTIWKLSENEADNIFYTFTKLDGYLSVEKFDLIYDNFFLRRPSSLELSSFDRTSSESTEVEWAIGDINDPDALFFYANPINAYRTLPQNALGLTDDNVRLVMKIVKHNILVEFNIHYWAPGGEYVSYSRGSGLGDNGVSEPLVAHTAEVWRIEDDNNVNFTNYSFEDNPAKEHDKIFDDLSLARKERNGLYNSEKFDEYNYDTPDGLSWLMVKDSWSLDDLKYIPIDMFVDEFKEAAGEQMTRLNDGFKYIMYYEPNNTFIEVDFLSWSSDGYSYVRGSSSTDLGGPEIQSPNLTNNIDSIKKFKLGNDSDITIEVNGANSKYQYYSDRLTYLSALSFESDEPFNSGLESEENEYINMMWYRGPIPNSLSMFKDTSDSNDEFDDLKPMEIVSIYLPSEKIAFELQLEYYTHNNSYKYTRPFIEETLNLGTYSDGFTSEQTNYALLVGNGTEETASNALALDYSGNMTISGDLNINSDEKIKNNIESLGATLALLTQIDGKKYNFKHDENNQTKIGLIAQEVEKFFPEIVSQQQGVKSVNYIALIPILINAIKEQQTQINKLINEK
jgi:hypothetical protein